jgi:hypothetical protein
VLRIFIAFKNPSPWPGWNPLPLGPVASTLTATPPRRLMAPVRRRYVPAPRRVYFIEKILVKNVLLTREYFI